MKAILITMLKFPLLLVRLSLSALQKNNERKITLTRQS